MMRGITTSLEELLALRYVAQQLHLPQQKITNSFHQGNYQSAIRGRGMDFVETRAYQPGDDIRTINWAVTARTGKPHTKIYQQEKERPIYLVVDFSSSMFFGTRTAFKSVIAAETAALIAWAGVKNGDRIGALLLQDQYEILLPCQRKQTLIELFKKLITATEPKENNAIDYSGALKRLTKIVRSGSLIYFLSDFYSLDSSWVNAMQHLAKSNDITHIFIYDPLEKTAPKNGQYLFRDHGKAESLLLDTTSRSLRTKYNAIFTKRLEDLKKLCFATGMQMSELCTNDDIVATLRNVLNRKK